MRLLLLIGLGVLAWMAFQGDFSEPFDYPQYSAPRTGVDWARVRNEPKQRDFDRKYKLDVNGFELELQAEFAVQGLVLSAKHYNLDKESKISPVDLALGWGVMADPALFKKVKFSQSQRFYRYSWEGEPPLSDREFIRNSANMHMIPANAAAHEALKSIRRGDTVKITGYLTNVHDKSDGWRWYSSRTRVDKGRHGCEIVYVETVEISRPVAQK